MIVEETRGAVAHATSTTVPPLPPTPVNPSSPSAPPPGNKVGERERSCPQFARNPACKPPATCDTARSTRRSASAPWGVIRGVLIGLIAVVAYSVCVNVADFAPRRNSVRQCRSSWRHWRLCMGSGGRRNSACGQLAPSPDHARERGQELMKETVRESGPATKRRPFDTAKTVGVSHTASARAVLVSSVSLMPSGRTAATWARSVGSRRPPSLGRRVREQSAIQDRLGRLR